jgi:hypothetical protein
VKKLFVILINDNIIRSTLVDLARLADAELWLISSPHYAQRLDRAQRAAFARILVPEEMETADLAALLDRELPRPLPEQIRFLTNDESCELACARLAARLSAPAWPTERLLPFVDKMASKAALAGTGLRLPRHLPFDRDRHAADPRGYCQEVAAQIGFPLVVKPVDRYASMDVRRLENLAALRAWARWASSPKDRNSYEIDEFISGTLYNFDGLVRDGSVVWSNVCRNLNPCLDFAAGRTLGVWTLPATDPVSVRVTAFAHSALAALRPPDGGVHMEIFLTPAGELVFLEVAARPPGGELRDIYLRTHGIDIDLAHYMLRAREPYALLPCPTGVLGAWAVTPRRAGRVTAIEPPELWSEHTMEIRVAIGETIERSSAHIVEPPSAMFMVYGTDPITFEHDMDLLRELSLYQVAS